MSDIYRLTVFDHKSGLPLFDHITDNFEVYAYDEMLFSGIIQGISLMFIEAINCGYVKEVKLERATVLIEQDHELNISYVLVVREVSDEIRNAFSDFIDVFKANFAAYIPHMNKVEFFNGASQIVEECFSFCLEKEISN